MFCNFFKKAKPHQNIDSSTYYTIKDNIVNKIKASKDSDNILNNINPKNVLNILMHVMVNLDSLKNGISGSDKKQLALNITYDIIQNSPISSENKKYVLNILDNVFDPFVENIIAVSKGKFDLNRAKSLFKSCTSCLYKNSTL